MSYWSSYWQAGVSTGTWTPIHLYSGTLAIIDITLEHCYHHFCISLTTIDPNIGTVLPTLEHRFSLTNSELGHWCLHWDVDFLTHPYGGGHQFLSTNSLLGHWSPHEMLMTSTKSSLGYWFLHWNSLSCPTLDWDIDPTLGHWFIPLSIWVLSSTQPGTRMLIFILGLRFIHSTNHSFPIATMCQFCANGWDLCFSFPFYHRSLCEDPNSLQSSYLNTDTNLLHPLPPSTSPSDFN